MVKSVNQTFVFFMELVMIGSLAYYGYKQSTFVNRYLLAILLPAIAITLWAIFAAPKSSNRLNLPYLVIFRAAMFLIASLLLYLSGNKVVAWITAIIAIVTQVIAYYTEDN